MPPAMPDPSSRRFVLSGLLLCFFFSGAAGLIYQVAWSKALGLIFGHTAYAVATVLAVFMGGLAAGSAWLGQWSESRERPIALYGWIELGVAATGAVSLAGLAGVRVRVWRVSAGTAVRGSGHCPVPSHIPDGRHAAGACARARARFSRTRNAPRAALLGQHSGRSCGNACRGLLVFAHAWVAANTRRCRRAQSARRGDRTQALA